MRIKYIPLSIFLISLMMSSHPTEAASIPVRTPFSTAFHSQNRFLWTEEEVYEFTKLIVVEEMQLEWDDVTYDSYFLDLDVDSLSMYHIVVQSQDLFEIEYSIGDVLMQFDEMTVGMLAYVNWFFYDQTYN